MNPICFRYRTRDLTTADLAAIQTTIATHYRRGRSHISRVLCETWAWRQANGQLKDYAARDLLLRLEEAGLVTLPPRQRVKNNLAPRRVIPLPASLHRPLSGELHRYPPPRLVQAQGMDRAVWDELIAQYHYLGAPKLIGEHLKQLVVLEDQVVGCLGWASAAWKIAPRDQFLGWTPAIKRTHLPLIANNVRFLILPWVRIPHLASKVLALSTRGLSAQWVRRYGHPVYVAETFVEVARFRGTCYRAANWWYLGQTQGYAKQGNIYTRHGQVKAIFLYPLHRHWRTLLTTPPSAVETP